MKRIKGFICAFVFVLLLALTLSACSSSDAAYDVNVAQSKYGSVFVVKDKAKAGDDVVLACMPKAGYKLEKYTVNGEEIEGSSFSMPSSDVEVSATFSCVTYGINYVIDGESVETDNPKTYTVEDGDIALNPPPKKDGFGDAGWYYYFTDNNWWLDELDDYKADVIKQGTTGELTLYAHYYNVPHAITVDESISHGEVYTSDDEADAGDEIHIYYTADAFYELEHILINGEIYEGEIFIMPYEDVEISAVFRPIEYRISYELDGGINPSGNPISFNIESDNFVFLPAEKDGSMFDGWFVDDLGIVEDINELIQYLIDRYEDGQFFEELTLWAMYD